MKKKRDKKRKPSVFEEKVQMINLAKKSMNTPANYKMSKSTANVHFNQRKK
jgi:hypothetical protein